MPNYMTLTYKGKTKTISEWSKHTGLTVSCIRQRLVLDWPIEFVLTTPSNRDKSAKSIKKYNDAIEKIRMQREGATSP